MQLDLVDQPELEGLVGHVRAAADRRLPVSGGVLRRLDGLPHATGEPEVDRSRHLRRRPVGHHEVRNLVWSLVPTGRVVLQPEEPRPTTIAPVVATSSSATRWFGLDVAAYQS